MTHPELDTHSQKLEAISLRNTVNKVPSRWIFAESGGKDNLIHSDAVTRRHPEGQFATASLLLSHTPNDLPVPADAILSHRIP
eukprot:CAMPEP_0196172862 /NCGR_PEP_ID=MMETSP0911-20130528/6411_1 /TAXON_ID=49265 /ORGANISM="Thalassiosira rotula, Strain GSO102" /LENGTH=82 /DNA_ID=CAMNT_0041439967 /DNA_START=36 /DNA_END=282 /DNA_ORIENTATION=-